MTIAQLIEAEGGKIKCDYVNSRNRHVSAINVEVGSEDEAIFNAILTAHERQLRKEFEPVVEALKWYLDEVEAMTRHIQAARPVAILAIAHVMSLDGGERGRESLAAYDTEKP